MQNAGYCTQVVKKNQKTKKTNKTKANPKNHQTKNPKPFMTTPQLTPPDG